eukprot:Skav201520  [mRNA]  locus=scaffold4516:18254:26296:- [translate_table: standard]
MKIILFTDWVPGSLEALQELDVLAAAKWLLLGRLVSCMHVNGLALLVAIVLNICCPQWARRQEKSSIKQAFKFVVLRIIQEQNDVSTTYNCLALPYEASPLAVNCSKSRLTRHMRTGKLRLLNAKISTGLGWDAFVSSEHAVDFERAGEAELPQYTFEKRVRLRTTSCGELIAKYGTPWYMKVDVEDRRKSSIVSMK